MEYNQISNDEYRKYFDSHRINYFDNKELVYINEKFKEYNVRSSNKWHLKNHIIDSNTYTIFVYEKKRILSIDKLEDEWFLVCDIVNRNIYKCDQFEGLVNCIEKIQI